MSGTNKAVEIKIPVPWGNIAGISFGNDTAYPVLCVHGMMDNVETFRSLIPMLPENLYYVCIDIPGHGLSSHAEPGYLLDFPWFIMCLRRVINHFKWSKLFYMGHSMGGHLGYVLAAIYPDLVEKLILLDTIAYSHILPEDTPKSIRQLLIDPILKFEKKLNFTQRPVYRFSEVLEKAALKRSTEVDANQIKGIVRRNLTKVGLDQFRFTLDERCKLLGPIPYTWEQLECFVKEIYCPVLVILGKKSQQTQPHKTLEGSPFPKNPNVTIHIMDGDHDLHLVNPQIVALLVSPFLVKRKDDRDAVHRIVSSRL